jgi:23S rRNA (uracil1939-C5)-methyltransferase
VPRRQPPARRDDAVLHCPHFGRCGGCSLLDQPIAWQIHDKLQALEQRLAPFLGGLRVQSEVPERPPRHVRTRLLYPVRPNEKGKPTVGLYAFRSHDLVRIESCETQDAWLTAFGLAAERALRDLGLEPFDPATGAGEVRALWGRIAAGSGEVLVGVVTGPGPFEQGPALANALLDAAARVPNGRRGPRCPVGVVRSISERDDEFLLGERHVPLRGRDHVVDRRGGLELRISAGSFYQVHRDADALLYRHALAMAGDVAGKVVVDGYGGVGAFGLRFARAGAAQVTIVEDNAAACRDAEHNAKANDLAAAVRVVRAKFAAAAITAGPDLLVVDPPRSGLQADGTAQVLRLQPRRLLHVACSAESLAADLGALIAGGYRLAALRLCDLFPHTEHVEVLALLERA